MPKYVRHQRHRKTRTRAQTLAANRKRRAPVRAPEPETAPDVTPESPVEPGNYVGYHVERSGTWYKLIGPDGEQVGPASRSEAEVLARIPGAD